MIKRGCRGTTQMGIQMVLRSHKQVLTGHSEGYTGRRRCQLHFTFANFLLKMITFAKNLISFFNANTKKGEKPGR